MQNLEIFQNSVPFSLSKLLLVTRYDKIFSGLNLSLCNNNSYLPTYVVHFKVVSLVFYAVITKFGEQEAYGMTVILFLARNSCKEKADWAGVWSRWRNQSPNSIFRSFSFEMSHRQFPQC